MEIEKIKLSHVRQSDEFAVCLSIAPDFPTDDIASFVVRESGCNLAVVACNDDVEKGKWGWCHLEKNEKEAIGLELIKIGANVDEWFFCLMYKTDDEEQP